MVEPTHAGGVVTHDESYLLVTARGDPSAWVLPKGHIEVGEDPVQTARREVLEESGIRAVVVAPLGVHPAGDASVAYYLMRYESEHRTREGRLVHWCTFEEALDRLAFEDAREVLRLAHERRDG